MFKGRCSRASDECAINYNTRHTDPGSGAGAPPQIRSCGRDIPVGSCRSVSRRTGSATVIGEQSAFPSPVGSKPSRTAAPSWRRGASKPRRWAGRVPTYSDCISRLSGHTRATVVSRCDCTGLCWLLQGRPVVALTADTAAIENAETGSVTVYRKHNKPALKPGRHFRPFLCDTCAGSVWRLVGVYWPPSFVKAELDRRERELGRRL